MKALEWCCHDQQSSPRWILLQSLSASGLHVATLGMEVRRLGCSEKIAAAGGWLVARPCTNTMLTLATIWLHPGWMGSTTTLASRQQSVRKKIPEWSVGQPRLMIRAWWSPGEAKVGQRNQPTNRQPPGAGM